MAGIFLNTTSSNSYSYNHALLLILLVIIEILSECSISDPPEASAMVEPPLITKHLPKKLSRDAIPVTTKYRVLIDAFLIPQLM